MGGVEDTENTMPKQRVRRDRSLKDIERDVKRASVLLDRVLDELSAVIGAEDARPAPAPGPPVPAGPAPSAKNVSLKAAGRGRVMLAFDAGESFVLTETLAELAAVLASPEGESDDEFVAWQSLEHIGKRLEKRLPRRFDSHVVSNLLWRLRKAFQPGQLDRLVETRAGRGARLRLKRQIPSICAGGPEKGE